MIRQARGSGTRTRGGRYLSLFGNLALWIVVAFNAWFLWPASFGGSATFILVNGSSMEPAYLPGDLLVARTGKPSVGDIVVYKPGAEYGNAKVVHQIVGGDGVTGWVMKGLNNDLVDAWRPTNDQVVGVVQVHFPSLGGAGVVLLSPLVWAAILVVALGLMMWPGKDEDDEGVDEDAGEVVGDGTPAEPVRAARSVAAVGLSP